MKRSGGIALAALLGVAVWYAGAGLQGTRQQAFAQAVGCLPSEESGRTPVGQQVPLEDPACFDAYKLSYFDVATAFVPSAGGYGGAGNSGGVGDALLRIVDAGNFGTTIPLDSKNTPELLLDVDGDVCANIYVYNDVQEQQECCSCPLTANSLLTFSVINDLTSNPFNPKESLSAGVIKVVGSSSFGPAGVINSGLGSCSNSPTATTAAGPYVIAGGLHEWINHTEMMFSPLGAPVSSTSVEAFTNAVLDEGELASLQAGCAAINSANSHASEAIGICTCGRGD